MAGDARVRSAQERKRDFEETGVEKKREKEESKIKSCHENKNIDSHHHTATTQHLQTVPFLNS